MSINNGRTILSIGDWVYICKYFHLVPQTVGIREVPSLTFVETRLYDIRNNKDLLSLFSHDNKIRISTTNNPSGYYEIDVADILKRDGNKPSEDIQKAVAVNVYRKRTIVDKVASVAEKTPISRSLKNNKK